MSERSALEVVRCDRDVAREGVAKVDEHHKGDRYHCCYGSRPKRVEPEMWRSDEHGVPTVTRVLNRMRSAMSLGSPPSAVCSRSRQAARAAFNCLTASS